MDEINANEALIELKETMDAQEKPKKSAINYLKSLVKKAVNSPTAMIAGANVLMAESENPFTGLEQLWDIIV